MFSTCCKVSTGIFFTVGLILMIVLLSLSIQNVSQDEWGIQYNHVERTLSNTVEGPGRYAINPASSFFKFKSTFVPWELIIDCWTSDIIEVTLDIAVQTSYIHEELPQVIFEFGDEDHFLPYVENVLKKTMRESCSNFTAIQYYSNRTAIQTDMLNRIENELPKLGTHITTGGYLQLRNIKLPDDFNTAIIAKQTVQQEILLALNQRNQSLIIAETTLSQSVNNATSITNNATLQGQAILFDAQQQAQAINVSYSNRVDVYSKAMKLLGLNATEYIRTVLQPNLLTNGNPKVFL